MNEMKNKHSKCTSKIEYLLTLFWVQLNSVKTPKAGEVGWSVEGRRIFFNSVREQENF